jgi:alternate signal-mediated exported protein
MKKSTKGALAAAAAGTLLLGGAGSLAFWNDATNVSGTSITSGHLKLTNSTCATADWILDEGAGAPHEATYSTQLLVPGDKLTKTCTIDVDAAGDHLAATFSADDTSTNPASNALLDELNVDATYAVNAGAPGDGQSAVAIADGDTITVKLSVSWPYGTLDNDSNVSTGLTAALNDISVTATQSDNH